MANEVSVEITIEEKDALRALTKLTRGIDTTTDKASKGAKKMDMAFASFAGNLAAGAALKGLGLITDGVKAMVSQIGTLTDAASVQEDAINDLNNALVRGGEFSKKTSLEMQKFASELQQVSKFGDEAILSQMAFAQSMGATGEQSKTVLAAAADMASALNIDLNSAVRNISKTLGGYAGELGEVIPELKNLTAEQLKAGLGIDLLAQKFKGAAESQISTFSGAIEQASNTFGDLQETLGFTITQSPVVIAAIKGLSKGVLALDGIVKENSETIRSYAEGVLIGALTGGINFAGQAVIKFNAVLVSTKNFMNFLVDGSLAALQGLQEFSAGLIGAVSSVQNFLGLSTEASDSLQASVLRSIEVTKLARLANDEEVANRIMRQQELAENVTMVTETINTAILSEATVKEGTDLRIVQSEKNKQILLKKTRDDAEKARQKAAEQNFLFQKAWDKQTQKEKVASLKGALGTIATLQQSGSKEGFAIGKAAAIADHGINAVSAVSKALGSAPPPFNFILAGLVGAAMAVQGAKIASASPPGFENGGVVGGFTGASAGPDNVNINARRGEMFLNASQQRNLFDDINNRSTGSNDGETIAALVNQPIILQVDNKEIARAVRNAERDGFQVAI